jgi:hypothetical protein
VRVFRREPEGKLVQAGSPDDCRTGVFKPSHSWRGPIRGFPEEGGPTGRHPSRLINQVFDRDRHSSKGSGSMAEGSRLLDGCEDVETALQGMCAFDGAANI